MPLRYLATLEIFSSFFQEAANYFVVAGETAWREMNKVVADTAI